MNFFSPLLRVSASCLLFLAGCKPAPPVQPKDLGPVTLAVPQHGAYTGAYMDFGDNEDDVSLETIESFERLVGKHQAIVASSSYWGEQSFPTANLNIIWRHGSILRTSLHPRRQMGRLHRPLGGCRPRFRPPDSCLFCQ